MEGKKIKKTFLSTHTYPYIYMDREAICPVTNIKCKLIIFYADTAHPKIEVPFSL